MELDCSDVYSITVQTLHQNTSQIQRRPGFKKILLSGGKILSFNQQLRMYVCIDMCECVETKMTFTTISRGLWSHGTLFLGLSQTACFPGRTSTNYRLRGGDTYRTLRINSTHPAGRTILPNVQHRCFGGEKIINTFLRCAYYSNILSYPRAHHTWGCRHHVHKANDCGTIQWLSGTRQIIKVVHNLLLTGNVAEDRLEIQSARKVNEKCCNARGTTFFFP